MTQLVLRRKKSNISLLENKNITGMGSVVQCTVDTVNKYAI